MAQLVVREFKSLLDAPGRFFPLSEQAMKKMERGLGELRWMNELYCTNVIMNVILKKTKQIKRVPIAKNIEQEILSS